MNSPIEEGFKGRLPFSDLFAYYQFLYFQDRPSCCLAPYMGENTYSRTNFPLYQKEEMNKN